eukprot:933807-Amphidinium_carterae.1
MAASGWSSFMIKITQHTDFPKLSETPGFDHTVVNPPNPPVPLKAPNIEKGHPGLGKRCAALTADLGKWIGHVLFAGWPRTSLPRWQ